MRAPSRATILLGTILAVALVLRIGAAAWWQSRLTDGARFGFGDSESYWQLGQAIAQGEPYQYGVVKARVFRVPGYPILLAMVMKLTGPSVAWARMASAVTATLAVGGVYWIGRQLFGVSTGLVAAAIAAVDPAAVAQGGLVLAEAPFCAVMVVHLALWQRGLQTSATRRSALWHFSAGLAAGAATLVRPSWLLFTPLAIVGQLFTERPRRRALIGALMLLAGLTAAMLPWWVRNARLVGHFVPTTLQVGASLFDGLNPEASGGSNMDRVQARQIALRRRIAATASATTDPIEYQVDRALASEAISWARSHPYRTVNLAVIKFLRTWNIWPNEESLRHPLARLLVLLSYVPVLLLALAGGYRYAPRGWPYALCLAPAVYFALLHVVFVGSIRYRQPAMLPLAVLAAAVLVDISRRRDGANLTKGSVRSLLG
jgi:4-amino-4-deoxy-L-arabinose transferase-like glycosyltransferase